MGLYFFHVQDIYRAGNNEPPCCHGHAAENVNTYPEAPREPVIEVCGGADAEDKPIDQYNAAGNDDRDQHSSQRCPHLYLMICFHGCPPCPHFVCPGDRPGQCTRDDDHADDRWDLGNIRPGKVRILDIRDLHVEAQTFRRAPPTYTSMPSRRPLPCRRCDSRICPGSP